MKIMKSTTTLLLFVLSATVQLYGQQPLFAPLGAVWHYDQFNCPGVPVPVEPVQIRVTEDTIINGKYCTKLENYGCHSNASCNDYVYVHQDGSKVFVYEPMFNDFQMLFDFSMQEGDSYTYILCKETWDTDTVTIHVEFASADPVGEMQFRIVPNQPTSWDEMYGGIVKGVGGTEFYNRLLFDEFYCQNITFDCPLFSFVCYETPDSINYPAGCFVSAVEEEAFDAAVYVNPNPAASKVTVSLPSTLPKPGTWLLYDQIGREVLTEQLPAGAVEHAINIGNIPPGLYFWRAMSEGALIGSGKLVLAR